MLTPRQLLGREYYQRPGTETLLVTLPIALHAGAAALKRVLPLLPPADPTHPGPRAPPRPLRSALAVSGYAALLALLPVHYPTHRLAPASSFGAALLDFEFVKAGLHAWPARSALLYTVLVGGTLVHAADGARVLLAARGWKAGSRAVWRAAGAVASVPVLYGVWVLAREPGTALEDVLAEFRRAFETSLYYRA
jgi:hypothetical protein